MLAIDRETCLEAARLHRACAAKGIAVSTIDCQIAAAAVHQGHAILTADADFQRIATIYDLELV